MNDAKSIIRHYRICVFLFAVCFWGIIIFINSLKLDSVINICLVLGICIFYRIIIYRIAFSKIHSILFLKFDAPKYKEVIFSKRLIPSVVHQTNAAAFNGEYQAVINLCSKVIDGKYRKKHKLAYIACMARSYYEMDDMKNLSVTCDIFDKSLANLKNKKIDIKIQLMMQYYKHFISGDYKMCILTLDEIEKHKNYKSPTEKISKIFSIYNYGVVSYKTGDYENALKYFNDIVTIAPKLQSAILAQKYIDAINNSTEFDCGFEEILPEKDFEIPFEKSRKRIFFVFRILIIATILFIVVFQIIAQKNYENKISNAVDNAYDNFASYKHFAFDYQDKIFANMCAVENVDGNFDIWFMVTYDNSETIELANVFREFNTYNTFSLYAPYDENILITFDVYDNAANIPHENFGVVAFVDSEKPFYLVVSDINIKKTLDNR